MFKQQARAVGYYPRRRLRRLVSALLREGYEVHDGLHVSGGAVAVYAHTEPHTAHLIAHAVSAVGDGASFSGGSRMVRAVLARQGMELLSRSDALRVAS